MKRDDRMTMEELAKRFLQITKKMKLVVKEKNFAMLDHFLLERNDIIELIKESQEEMTPQGMSILEEAREIQNLVDLLLEQHRTELLQVRAKVYQNHQVNRQYQKSFFTGNALRK